MNFPGENPTKAILYSRVACTDIERIMNQENKCRTYAEALGYEVIAAFQDNGVSGAKADRAGLNALMASLQDVAEYTRHVVIAEDTSRLARDITIFSNLSNTFHKSGAIFETVEAGA